MIYMPMYLFFLLLGCMVTGYVGAIWWFTPSHVVKPKKERRIGWVITKKGKIKKRVNTMYLNGELLFTHAKNRLKGGEK